MKKIFLFALLVALVAACNNGDEPAPTRTQLLAKDWQWVRGTINGSPYTPQNLAGMVFRADGTYTIRDRAGSGLNGTWAFNSNETKIILNGQVELNIITLTATTLIYEFESVNYKNGNLTTQYEFKPI